jgi:hypothetical protein
MKKQRLTKLLLLLSGLFLSQAAFAGSTCVLPRMPFDFNKLSSMAPLGLVYASGHHVFPETHSYFTLKPDMTTTYTPPTPNYCGGITHQQMTDTFVAPGNITVTEIAVQIQCDGFGSEITSYRLRYKPGATGCANTTLGIGQLNSLDPLLAASAPSCTSQCASTHQSVTCIASTNISVPDNHAIGQIGGGTGTVCHAGDTHALELYAFDNAHSNDNGLKNPSEYGTYPVDNPRYATCPAAMFPLPAGKTWPYGQAHLDSSINGYSFQASNWSGIHDLCGVVTYDPAGGASGNWFQSSIVLGLPANWNNTNYQFSLSWDSMDKNTEYIAMGEHLTYEATVGYNFAPYAYAITPSTAVPGVNPPFSSMVPGKTYCFEGPTIGGSVQPVPLQWSQNGRPLQNGGGYRPLPNRVLLLYGSTGTLVAIQEQLGGVPGCGTSWSWSGEDAHNYMR